MNYGLIYYLCTPGLIITRIIISFTLRKEYLKFVLTLLKRFAVVFRLRSPINNCRIKVRVCRRGAIASPRRKFVNLIFKMNTYLCMTLMPRTIFIGSKISTKPLGIETYINIWYTGTSPGYARTELNCDIFCGWFKLANNFGEFSGNFVRIIICFVRNNNAMYMSCHNRTTQCIMEVSCALEDGFQQFLTECADALFTIAP